MPNVAGTIHYCWGALSRFWIMAAASHLLWNFLPQLMLFMPDFQQRKAAENVTEIFHISKLSHRPFPDSKRILLREEIKRMFYWGYDNYMTHAFPFDELDPIECLGRGHDWKNPLVNIVTFGDFALNFLPPPQSPSHPIPLLPPLSLSLPSSLSLY